VAAGRRAVAVAAWPVSRAFLAQSLAVNGERVAALAEARQVLASERHIPYFVSDMLWPVLAYAGDWRGTEEELRRWSGPDALPARQASSRSALSFLLTAQGRAREVRGARGRDAGRHGARAVDVGDGDGRDAGGRRRSGGALVPGVRQPAAAPFVAFLGDLDGAAELARGLAPGSTEADLYRAVESWRRGSADTAIPILRA